MSQVPPVQAGRLFATAEPAAAPGPTGRVQDAVRTQPRHILPALDAQASLVDLLDHWDNRRLSAARELPAVAIEFAVRSRDRPDHPERRPR